MIYDKKQTAAREKKQREEIIKNHFNENSYYVNSKNVQAGLLPGPIKGKVEGWLYCSEKKK